MEETGWQTLSETSLTTVAYVDGKKCVVRPLEDGRVEPVEDVAGGASDYLTGTALAARAEKMTYDVETGHIRTPPPPTGSKDIRVYGSQCVETQRNDTQAILGLPTPFSLTADTSVTTHIEHPNPTNPTVKPLPDMSFSRSALARCTSLVAMGNGEISSHSWWLQANSLPPAPARSSRV
jgi:hypothetical protein